jgi:site-specific recombinase XerD
MVFPASDGCALRDRALILFLSNTGARVREAADLPAEHLDLSGHPRARLQRQGHRWRCERRP